ncbi:MAG: primosomal protein N' [Anaerorhabdus sp.]
MYFIQCWIEHPSRKLDKTYGYYSNNDNIKEGMRVLVGFGHQKIIGFVESVEKYNSLAEIEEKVGFKCKEVISLIDEESLLTEELLSLAKQMAKDTISPTITCFKAMLPSKLKPSSKSKKMVMEKWIKAVDTDLDLTVKQKEVWDFLKINDVKYSDIIKSYKSIPKTLINKGKAITYLKEKKAVLINEFEQDTPLVMQDDQKNAMDSIYNSEKLIHLIHGVTGSGKTEVYLQLAQKYILNKKQVLILVPEISLTPQMISRVKKRFNKFVAIYHSSLNDQEKYEQYKLVKNGEVSIVVGTRSAVFMPFSNLGLIIIDEEHDLSYKQTSTPTYHCRDIAIERSKYFNCKVILGSATPSLETYSRALKGIYNLVELPNRINKVYPDVRCIDVKDKLKKGESSLLMPELKSAIAKCLDDKKQVIILLNRRGFHTIIKCNSCLSVLMCKHCDVALSYHHKEKCLKCHVCGTDYKFPSVCPSCNVANDFSGDGIGIQKVEFELQNTFKNARIMRMDADTTRRKNSHQTILDKFGNKEVDILIGTQMIAKGLDYPDVTLVGILNADVGLSRSDYRSVESTFDLIVQASGRSGRAKDAGEVLIQVFNKNHYAIKTAIKNDYKSFFTQEMNYRKIGQYPPYTYLISIVIIGKNFQDVSDASLNIKNKLIGEFKVLGPSDIGKLKDNYRFRIITKGKDLNSMRDVVSKAVNEKQEKNDIKIIVDVNPLSID